MNEYEFQFIGYYRVKANNKTDAIETFNEKCITEFPDIFIDEIENIEEVI